MRCHLCLLPVATNESRLITDPRKIDRESAYLPSQDFDHFRHPQLCAELLVNLLFRYRINMTDFLVFRRNAEEVGGFIESSGGGASLQHNLIQELESVEELRQGKQRRNYLGIPIDI